MTMVAVANSLVSMIDFPVPNKSLDLELAHRIDAKTFRQVHNLRVVRNDETIILRGQSQSYYVKQLATHAVLDMFPGQLIDNAISVRNS